VRLNLDLNLKLDSKLVGAQAVMTGGGLQPASAYVLTMHSTPVVISSGRTDASGDFRALIVMPAKACVSGGLHQLILTGIAPNGTVVRDSNWVTLSDTCVAHTGSGAKPANDTVVLSSFLFSYQSAKLWPSAQRSLRGTVSMLRGAKLITITGYTQTKKQSKAARRANKLLAMRRAVAVRKYLHHLGVKTAIRTVGAGGVSPVNKKKQSLNRRVIITVRY
jgi:outer membrane protein OmpA-like peptidoglycan-associated protein